MSTEGYCGPLCGMGTGPPSAKAPLEDVADQGDCIAAG